MVAGKVKVAMGLQKSPASRKSDVSTKPPLPSPTKTVFSRSFGVYFPRTSAQVQPRPPDVSELLRLVEELRERESRLQTELIEQKLLKESIVVIPVLENEITCKAVEIEKASKRIGELEAENERLRKELQEVKVNMGEERRASERKVKELEAEIAKTTSHRRGQKGFLCETGASDDLSSFQGLIDVSVRSNLMKNLKKVGKHSSESNWNVENHKIEANLTDFKKEDADNERPRLSRCNSEELAETSGSTLSSSVRSRAPRVPKPPPKRSSSSSSSSSSFSSETEVPVPPPPPPPPVKPVVLPPRSKTTMPTPPPPPPPFPAQGTKMLTAKVRRVPEVVEFYHSLMRRDSRRDSGAAAADVSSTTCARDMIGEIENRSAHLLAIKTDVETQGDFIRFLIKEVENAAFSDMEDVVLFVKWLDDELSYLVDERAVLKHFDWPEKKADALREAAFGYCDLKKLESEAATSFCEDARQPSNLALKKMQALFEKLEHGVYNLSRLRESAVNRYKLFHIPVDWMLDTGFVSQIKLASVILAAKYMKRVSAELETVGSGGPEEEELIVQGVRFAFRVHQFAGGFDAETMRAFQELRDKTRACHIHCQNQQQQKIACKSTAG